MYHIFLGAGAGGSGPPPPTKPPNFSKPTPAPPLDLGEDEEEEKKERTYPPLILTPLKPCGTREDGEVAPQVSRIFPAGGPEALVTDPTLPLHPGHGWIGREQCNRASVRQTEQQILEIQQRIAEYDTEIAVFRRMDNEEQEIYNNVVDNFPRTSTFNIRKRVEAYAKYSQRSNDHTINMVMARFRQQQQQRRLDELSTLLEAQRTGWGYARIHPRHEFVVMFPQNVPIIQRTQDNPRPVNARRRLNLDDSDDENELNSAPPKKRPRDRRDTREPCIIVPFFNITYLTDLTNPENVAGIYIFQDKNEELKQKLKHVTDVFNIISKTLHAWHNSYFYSNLHAQMKASFMEFQSNVSNISYSSFDKKMLAMQSILVHLKKFMDENFEWYTNPQEVPEKIISLFRSAQNSL